jgi:N-acetylglucosaminyl-diphospho-decaprenol L-rhamnosyltransferase
VILPSERCVPHSVLLIVGFIVCNVHKKLGWVDLVTNMSLEIDLSIVIVSWNVADLLADCLDSIYKSALRIVSGDSDVTNDDGDLPIAEVIVVDSASSDNTVAMLREKYAWVHLIACEENIGFVRGINLGTQHAQGRLIFWLNPDTQLHADAIPRLMAVLEQDEATGAVGPHTLNADGSHQSTRRRFPTFWTAVFESTWLESVAPPGMMARFRVEDQPNDDVYPVGWVQGSALMFKRAVYEQIGGLDERYVMYAEEMDWCKRAQDAGWQVYYVGDARMTHFSGQSTAQVKTRSHVHFQHSKLRYFQKFHGTGAALALRVVLILNYTWQLILEGSKWLIGHKRPLRAERVAAYWVVLKSLLWAGEDIISPAT